MFDFISLKKQVAAIGGKARAAQQDLENLRRRREEVAAAPTSKVDAIRVMQDQVDAQAELHKRVLFANLIQLVDKGDPDRMNAAPFLSATRHDTACTHKTFEGGMCLAFGTQMKQAIAQAINDMPWPEMSMDSVQKSTELSRIDADIAAAENELADLVRECHAAGVNI